MGRCCYCCGRGSRCLAWPEERRGNTFLVGRATLSKRIRKLGMKQTWTCQSFERRNCRKKIARKLTCWGRASCRSTEIKVLPSTKVEKKSKFQIQCRIFFGARKETRAAGRVLFENAMKGVSKESAGEKMSSTASEDKAKLVPITLLSGFLGAGLSLQIACSIRYFRARDFSTRLTSCFQAKRRF